MNKLHLYGALCATVFSVITLPSHAALVERLGGLAYYDDVADLTWLADASYSTTQFANSGGTEGNANARTNWATANAWATGLNIAGVTGWRLPANVDIGNDGCNNSYSGTDCGYNVDPASGELANLFSNVLGIVPYKDTEGNNSPDWDGVSNTGPFSNILSGYYWSSTPYIPDGNIAWVFSTFYSHQTYASKTGSSLRSWAVHSGDVGNVPVPAAVWLFGSGLLGLVGIARRKKA